MQTQFYVWEEIPPFKYKGNYFSNEKTLDNSTEIAPFNDFCEWNGAEWIDPRSEEEINKVIVPEVVSRMNLKIQLLLKEIAIEDIIDTINSIPSYMFPDVEKQIAIIKFNEAAYFDRYNADLQLVATLMGLSQKDLDEIFINGNKV